MDPTTRKLITDKLTECEKSRAQLVVMVHQHDGAISAYRDLLSAPETQPEQPKPLG